MSPTDAHTLLSLLRGAPFSAPYLGETIDWIRRSVRHEVEQAPFPLDLEDETLRRLEAYAGGTEPGAAELAQRLADVRHAVATVRHEHYTALVIGQSSRSPAARVSRGSDVLKLATAVGRARVTAGPTGAIVIAAGHSGSTVFRPITSESAHRLRNAARERKEESVRRAVAIRQLLAKHVRMADWSDPSTAGVVVDSPDETVSVSWWDSEPIGGPGPWDEGGVRPLCLALLSGRGYTVTLAADGSLSVSG
ncbi:hypothetical protein [Streptomyces sp. RKAG337]|uniref:hypothetical protein n=1 Tax=Streptomyces sp. RKAG337 TaxID=2893404 RepID=UPI002033CDBB|nr:hypothetical protein [Streptomyces sp. RKAG337]MCM2430919.1 hypothetical protein [Streptomyces sp. RKAG337]